MASCRRRAWCGGDRLASLQKVQRPARGRDRAGQPTPPSLASQPVPQGPAHAPCSTSWSAWPPLAVASFTDQRRDRRALRLRADPGGRCRLVCGTRLHPRGAPVRGRAAELERRAEEVLTQEELRPAALGRAPRPRRPARHPRLRDRPVYQAGTGLMAGDFYDVFRPRRRPAGRGHRRRHRPRHRAVDHRLPGQVPAAGLPARVPRPGPGARGAQQPSCRPASAGRGVRLALRRRVRHRGRHAALRVGRPPRRVALARREVQPLRATGPLLMLDPAAAFLSPRDRASRRTTCSSSYTDGLAEARDGGQFFGEERIGHGAATRSRRATPEVLCKTLRRGGAATSRRARSPTTSPIVARFAAPDVSRPAHTDASDGPRSRRRRRAPPRRASGPCRATSTRRPRSWPARTSCSCATGSSCCCDAGSFVEDGLLANADLAATTCPPTAWSPASARSTAGRCA